MRSFFIVLLLVACGVALVAFASLLFSQIDTRLVLSRFDPSLSEPIPEASLPALRAVEAGTYTLTSGTTTFSLTNSVELRDSYIGTTHMTAGKLTLAHSEFGDWSGDGVLLFDMSSLVFPLNGDLLDLRTSDFFAVDDFPHAALTIKNVARHGDSSVFNLVGRLTMLGQTHDVLIPEATIYARADTLVLEADFNFDRTQWGMTHASPTFSGAKGYSMLDDTVHVGLSAQFPLSATE